MDLHIALTTTMHAVRHLKPESQIAEETGIAPNQLKKYRTGARSPIPEHVKSLIRCIHEADPAQGAILVNAVLPTEIYTAQAIASDPSSLSREIMEATTAIGHVSQSFVEAQEDGLLDHQELDLIQTHYIELQRQAAEGLAAVEKARKVGKLRTVAAG